MDFEAAWKAYNDTLGAWKAALAGWQKATADTLEAYNIVRQRAQESDPEMLKKLISSWEATWTEIGPEFAKQEAKMIDSIFKETNAEAIKKFNEQWEKFLKASGDDAIRSYQEAISKFDQIWQSGKM